MSKAILTQRKVISQSALTRKSRVVGLVSRVAALARNFRLNRARGLAYDCGVRGVRPKKIKIWGISAARDADLALAEGADLLGFVFLQGPRRADPRLVREIVRRLPNGIEAVGLFRNQPLAEVRSILGESAVTI